MFPMAKKWQKVAMAQIYFRQALNTKAVKKTALEQVRRGHVNPRPVPSPTESKPKAQKFKVS